MIEAPSLTAELSPIARAEPRRGRWVMGAGAAVVVLLFAIALVLYAMNGGAQAPNGRDYTLGILIASLAFGVPGALLSGASPVPVLGWVSLAAGISFGLDAAMTGWALRSLQSGGLPGGGLALWMSVWCWMPGYGLVGTVLLLLLPDGRLHDRWQRLLAVISAAAIAAATVGMALGPFTYSDLPRAYSGHANPVLDRGLAQALGWGAALLIPCVALSLASLIVRYRRSSADAREQLRWVAMGGVLTIALLAGAFAAGSNGDLLFAAAMVPLPAGVTIAVLKHGLWDIDVVINRSLVYLTLSVAAVLVYAGAVAAVNRTVGGIVALMLIVVGLHPLHWRVQRAVNRLLYGERDDPAAALRSLADRLAAVVGVEDVLPAAAETVARALRLPFVAVQLPDGGGASYGRPAGEPTVLPLNYQGRQVGELIACPRDPGSRLSARDLRSLEAVARQLGTAAHAVTLSDELQRSRERIVLAREEERRRLRRELHDGLGPTLAALALELDGARELIVSDPGRVDATLERAAARASETVSDVRRIVYDLRPPALDDLGLVAAIREQAERLSAGGVAVSVDAPSVLPPLPAAIEAAAYRILSEALANVIRHAAARNCTVELRLEQAALLASVTDDGRGFDDSVRPGVGMSSMRERAAELGGTLEVRATPGFGTKVSASLPVVVP